jgi:hypothetical protein
MACRRKAPPGYWAAPRASFRVTAIRASIPHAYAPAALRATLASGGSAQGPSPPRRLGAPAIPPNRRRRIGQGQRPAVWAVLGGCAVACCGGLCECVPSPTLWQFVAYVSRMTVNRYATRPSLGLHTALQAWLPAWEGTCSCWSLGNGLAESGGVPLKPSCGDAELAMSPFGVWVRPKASLCCCESWRGHGCASDFMAATVRRKQFPLRCAHSSRAKFFSPPGAPLRCARKRCSQPVPRRSDHNKDAMGANLVQP